MESLNILLLLFTLLIMDYCKSEMLHVRKRILDFLDKSKETLNTNEDMDIKCHYLNYINFNDNIKENNFKLTITGRVVRFKNIPFKYNCNGTITVVEIFATEEIIIDQSFNAKGKSIVFVVAAPIWHVVGKQMINLNGYNGKKRKKSNARNGISCKNKNGAHGKEGFPGGPGGQFHGIAGYIINKYNLKVYFNGGKGSHGQNGGKGAKGRDGTGFDLDPNKIQVNGSVSGFTVAVQNVQKLYINQEPGDFYYITETVFGKKAQSGGNGGNGGPGGRGGLPGYHFLFDLKSSACGDTDLVRFVDTQIGRNGEDGSYGFGGHGGEEGRPGKDVFLNILVSNDNKIDILNHTTFDHVQFENKSKNGFHGKFVARTLQPKKHSLFQIFDNSEQFFRKFLRSHWQEFNNTRTDPWIRELQIALLQCPYYRRTQFNNEMQQSVF